MRILLIGGYGTFGGRLAELLADIGGLEILIAGRSFSRAEAFCRNWSGAAAARPVVTDRSGIAATLAAQHPDIVVDASGPFQNYGDDPYSVIRACIAGRVHYLDFADGSDFVAGVPRFDADARAAGVFVLSGVSSFPVLTAAVLRAVGKGMRIRRITAGIAPSPYAGMGANVMRAVLGYAGGPVQLRRGGQQTTAVGLAESRRYTVAPPGLLPLANLRFSLVDVPDLQVLPAQHPEIEDIWVGAAPLPEFLHRALNVLAWARARLHLPSLVPLAPVCRWVLDRCRFGEHRGGMFVEIEGDLDGRPITRSWHMIAEGDDGPMIPSMAIEGIVRRHLDGRSPAPGARAATRDLELSDYDTLFAARDIRAGTRSSDDDARPLYPAMLGSAFDTLPGPVRKLHESAEPRAWSGTARVRRGPNPLARLIAAVIGFPPAADSIPVRVAFTPTAGGGELWERNFGGRRFRSYQRPGTGRDARLLVERFGAVSVALALVVRDGRLYLVPRRWSFLGLPLPRMLLPRGTSFEAEEDGRFRFDVEIAAPLIGLIVGYRGTLTAEAGGAPRN